jgi:hypothetical protein
MNLVSSVGEIGFVILLDLHVRLFFVDKRLMFLDTRDRSAAQENNNKCCAAYLNWKKLEPKSQEFNQEHLWPLEDAEQSLEP